MKLKLKIYDFVCYKYLRKKTFHSKCKSGRRRRRRRKIASPFAALKCEGARGVRNYFRGPSEPREARAKCLFRKIAHGKADVAEKKKFPCEPQGGRGEPSSRRACQNIFSHQSNFSAPFFRVKPNAEVIEYLRLIHVLQGPSTPSQNSVLMMMIMAEATLDGCAGF